MSQVEGFGRTFADPVYSLVRLCILQIIGTLISISPHWQLISAKIIQIRLIPNTRHDCSRLFLLMHTFLCVHPSSKLRIVVIHFWNQCIARSSFVFYKQLEHWFPSLHTGNYLCKDQTNPMDSKCKTQLLSNSFFECLSFCVFTHVPSWRYYHTFVEPGCCCAGLRSNCKIDSRLSTLTTEFCTSHTNLIDSKCKTRWFNNSFFECLLSCVYTHLPSRGLLSYLFGTNSVLPCWVLYFTSNWNIAFHFMSVHLL